MYLLRASYLFVSAGLAVFIWPDILAPQERLVNEYSIISSLLGAIAVLAALGFIYPLRMLPVLIFEFLWKMIWVIGFALPVKATTGLDEYGQSTLFDCNLGIALMLLTIPWDYVYKHYIKGKPRHTL